MKFPNINKFGNWTETTEKCPKCKKHIFSYEDDEDQLAECCPICQWFYDYTGEEISTPVMQLY